MKRIDFQTSQPTRNWSFRFKKPQDTVAARNAGPGPVGDEPHGKFQEVEHGEEHLKWMKDDEFNPF